MGVFDGSAYRVDIYKKGEDPDDPETYNMDEVTEEFLQAHRDDPGIRAVEVFNLHYMIGDYRGDLSFGNPWEEEDE